MKYNSTFPINLNLPSQQHVNDSVYEHHYQSDNKTDVIIWVRTRVPIKKLNPIARHFILRYVVRSVTESHIGEQALKNAALLAGLTVHFKTLCKVETIEVNQYLIC